MTIHSERIVGSPLSWAERHPRLLRWLWPSLIAVAVVAVLAANLSGPSATGSPVRLSPVARGSLSVEILAVGSVEAEERIEVRWPFSAARVAAVLVEPGERVEAGRSLVRLDRSQLTEAAHRERAAFLEARQRLAAVEHGSRDKELALLELAVDQARRKLSFQEARRRQTEELAEAGVVSRMDLDSAQFEVESARLAVREAELRLESFRHDGGADEEEALREEVESLRLAAERARRAAAEATLVAPRDATVLALEIDPGELLLEGGLAVELADMSRFRISLLVDELEVRRIAPGQEVLLTSEYFGAETVTGVVERVVPSVRDRRGVPSVEVLVGVPGADGWEPPAGLGVEARIRIDRAEGVVTVPLESVVERQGTNGVFVVDEEKARFRPVGLGMRNESRVEVVSGVEPGQEVIVGGHVFLQDGDPVVPTRDESSGSLMVEFFE